MCRKGDISEMKTTHGDVIVDTAGNMLHGLLVEPVTHLTTNEFIKLVEYMGYECVDYGGHLETRKNNCVVSINYKVEQYAFSINYPMTKQLDENDKQMLFKVNYIYANTPLELRGENEKEQLYTLELPNTNSCYRYYVRDNYAYLFDDIHDDNGYQNKFTQKEIDELKQGDHGDLIKMLKQEPVK